MATRCIRNSHPSGETSMHFYGSVSEATDSPGGRHLFYGGWSQYKLLDGFSDKQFYNPLF